MGTIHLVAGTVQEVGAPSTYDTTSATYIDTNYTAHGLQPPVSAGTTTPFSVMIPTAITGTMWLHFHYKNANSNYSGSSGYMIRFFDNSNNLLGYWDIASGNFFASATGDTTVNGANFPLTNGTFYEIDISVAVTGSNIVINIYVNGALQSTATAANTVGGKGTPRFIYFDLISVSNSASGEGFSEIIVSEDENMIGKRVKQLLPNAAGALSAWSGAYGNLSDLTDATGIYSTASGQRFTWLPPTWSTPASVSGIRALALVGRAKKGTTGPQHVKQSVRISSTNYDGASLDPATDIAMPGRICTVWDQNPATGVDWVIGDFSGIEFGVLSAA